MRAICEGTASAPFARRKMAVRVRVVAFNSGRTALRHASCSWPSTGGSTYLYLQHGDIVNVRDLSQQKVFMLGEIQRPVPVTIRRGRLSLAAALGEAGGPRQATSDPSRIFVVRNNAGKKPQIFRLNAESAAGMLLADQFEMEPQDVVFVDTAGVSTWNRVISQIVPTVQVVGIASGI